MRLPRQSNPALATAILEDDLPRFVELIGRMQRMSPAEAARAQMEAELRERVLRNPMDVEAQRAIQEMIRRENVEENMRNALEYNPESFGQVTMLWIPCEVNGVKVKAFVDSGAQTTIMSQRCARICNIMHLIDERFSGIARGVGAARILGRVHMAQLKIGDEFFVSSVTILEGNGTDFLLGLDMLRRHQASIDLAANVLRIGRQAVSFLPEHEIPKADQELAAADEMDALSGGGGLSVTGAPPAATSQSQSQAAQSAPAPAPAALPAAAHAPAQTRTAAPPRPTPAGTRRAVDAQRERDIAVLVQESGAPRHLVEVALDSANGVLPLALMLLLQQMQQQ